MQLDSENPIADVHDLLTYPAYLWSVEVAQLFADALRINPDLHLVAVLPRYPTSTGGWHCHRTWSAASRRSRCAGGPAANVCTCSTGKTGCGRTTRCLGRLTSLWALPAYRLVYDPDGRLPRTRRRGTW